MERNNSSALTGKQDRKSRSRVVKTSQLETEFVAFWKIRRKFCRLVAMYSNSYSCNDYRRHRAHVGTWPNVATSIQDRCNYPAKYVFDDVTTAVILRTLCLQNRSADSIITTMAPSNTKRFVSLESFNEFETNVDELFCEISSDIFFLILKRESKFEVFDLASLINLYVCDTRWNTWNNPSIKIEITNFNVVLIFIWLTILWILDLTLLQ